jgi:hypothetical protein
VSAPCVADYEIAHLDLDLVLTQIVELARVDMERRQALAACTPLPWDTAKPYGAEL